MARRFAGAAFLAAAALACGRPSAPPARSTPEAAAALPPPPAGALEFLVVGDWGRGGNAPQRRVADAMAAWAFQRPIRFVVSTGDNFYEDGVSSATDRAWKTSFEDVYAAPSLLRIPWIVALGNHDYRGNVDAQVEYSKSSPRWRMPARSFTVQETAGDGTRVQFFVMDTTPFLATYRSFPSRTKVAGQDPAAQLRWLADGLAASTADWKIVVGHHPIHSCGPHGDSAELVRDVLPVLARFHVAVYLNGHEHGLQHLESGGIHFLTSGGGSETTRVSPDGRTVWAEATDGFLALAASRETLQVRAVNGLGTVRHEAVIPRPARAPNRPAPLFSLPTPVPFLR